jgi:hypothetical protein
MGKIRLVAAMAALASAVSVGALVSTSGPAGATPVGDQLAAGATLGSGDWLDSPGATYRLVMQTDGNLVEYTAGGQALWQTSTSSAGASLVNGSDGNLAIQATDGTVVWSTNYDPGRGPADLTVQDDGNLVDRAFSGSVIWVTYATAGGPQLPADGAARFARQQLGKPYSFGANGPSSYDASGLVQASYAVVCVSLPHNSAAQAAQTSAINRSDLRPGDLVFYGTDSIGTVAIYVGNDQVIGVFHAGTVVHAASIDFQPIYAYTRVV